jgi:TonB family protein
MRRGRAGHSIASSITPSIASSIALASILALAACGGSAAPSGPAPAQSKYRAYAADDEQDEHVAVVSSRGVLEPEQVEAGMSPHRDELSSCYLGHAAGRRWLGGALVLRWAIDAKGQTLAVHVAQSDLGAWPVERCLLEVARKMRFEAPRGGPTDFTVPLGFSSAKPAAALSEEESEQAVGKQLAQLATCTTGELAAPPHLMITLYAGNRGVLSVGFATTTTTTTATTTATTAEAPASASGLSDAWADCAEKLALTWKVPLPPGDAKDARAAPRKLTLLYAATP